MKKYWIGIIAGLIVLIGCFGGYKVYADHLEQKHFQEANSALSHLFEDKAHKILANDVNQSLLNSSQKKIAILKNQKNKWSLQRVLDKAKLLFTKEINAKKKVNELLTKGVLADQVTESQVDTVQKLVSSLTDHTLQTYLQKRLDIAKAQLKAQVTAEQTVNALFTGNTHAALADKVTRDSYSKAINLANAIQNQAKKKELTNLLAKADTLLKQKEEIQAQAQAQAKTAASTTSPAAGTSSPGASNQTASPQAAGFAGIVAGSKTAQKTDQIVTVVGIGTSATVTFWKKTNNQWGEVFSTNGMVGSQGIGQASEGSSRTPKGVYTLGFAFGKTNPGTKLPFRQITPTSYWISDVNSRLYNTWQEGSFAGNGNEHLEDYADLQYYYAIVINYNMNAVKGAGSGFFLHVSNGHPTAGCVAVPKNYMEKFMLDIHPGAYIINVTSENEVANY